MYLKVIGNSNNNNSNNTMNWMDSAQDRDYWRALINAALIFQVL
jgi:hypothetical protein